ncbi:cytochrome c [Bradyrhizobium sp. LTSPM299]|uniref:c-type cytochrome n=1 Tax=Bradyrhizobium sp. LTSPM299 TaxID=1619233 RepID=UPI0006786F8D|nr:cytochrome c [Bradyrhizobium sp. LTSPM299]
MSSPCQNPERLAAARRLLPFALVAVLAVVADNASAQQATAPDAQHGPSEVFVSGLFPNGGAPPPQDRIGRRFEGNKLAIAAGKQLFGQMNCTGCHFNGGGGMGPALMSGHWRYGGRIDQIYASIAQGRPNGMPSWQDTLEPTMMWDLAAYVKSLSAPASASASQTAVPGTSVKP